VGSANLRETSLAQQLSSLSLYPITLRVFIIHLGLHFSPLIRLKAVEPSHDGAWLAASSLVTGEIFALPPKKNFLELIL
jgi:hypothetical protein